MSWPEWTSVGTAHEAHGVLVQKQHVEHGTPFLLSAVPHSQQWTFEHGTCHEGRESFVYCVSQKGVPFRVKVPAGHHEELACR